MGYSQNVIYIHTTFLTAEYILQGDALLPVQFSLCV